MTKNELMKAVAIKTEKTQKEVALVIDALDAVIKDAMVDNDTVKVLGVTFKTKDVPEKTGTIQLGDKKGEKWTKPAHTEVTVKASKNLKGMLAE